MKMHTRENEEDLAEKIEYLYYHSDERKEMGQNNLKLYLEKFDRSKTYSKIVDALI